MPFNAEGERIGDVLCLDRGEKVAGFVQNFLVERERLNEETKIQDFVKSIPKDFTDTQIVQALILLLMWLNQDRKCDSCVHRNIDLVTGIIAMRAILDRVKHDEKAKAKGG